MYPDRGQYDEEGEGCRDIHDLQSIEHQILVGQIRHVQVHAEVREPRLRSDVAEVEQQSRDQRGGRDEAGDVPDPGSQ